MLLGVAGPGGQFPRPVPVPYIIGSSRHTVCTSIIISVACSFFNHFCLFSRFFARFCTIFRIFGPLAPRTERNWKQEYRTREQTRKLRNNICFAKFAKLCKTPYFANVSAGIGAYLILHGPMVGRIIQGGADDGTPAAACQPHQPAAPLRRRGSS
jgi:hypothetical protein